MGLCLFWVILCPSLCSPFMEEKCDQHHAVKCGQSRLLPHQSDATCSPCHRTGSGSVTAALVAC